MQDRPANSSSSSQHTIEGFLREHEDHGDLENHPLIQGAKLPLTKKEEVTGQMQFYALCWSIFLLGWNDGSIGPLLPRIQAVYEVGYATVSWIFVLACTGVVFGALVNMPLTDRFGFGKMLVFGSLFQAVAFTTQSLALPFPMFAFTFFFGGIGMAMQDAHANGFIATVRHGAEFKMGFLHAAYGVGALVAPLSATQFAQMKHWSYHYLISLFFSLFNTLILAAVFRFKEQDACLAEAGEIIPDKVEEPSKEGKYSQLLKMKAVHLLALFLLVYIGIEVTIGGWSVTFMMIVRGGGPSSGYVASGFFGGLTLGRVILIWVNRKIGEVRAIYVYTVLAVLFQLVVWLVPSLIAGSISICCIGILLGPMYPIAMNHTSRIIPRSLVTGSIGWIAACGAAGSPLLPFFTGTMAEEYGIGSLQPFLVVMMILMGTLWVMVPKAPL